MSTMFSGFKNAKEVLRSPIVWSVGLSLYLVLVRILRYQRSAATYKKHGIRSREDFGKLTADQAQDILLNMVEMEFPKLMGFSIVFALFKTYGVPSVSALLGTTGELSSAETASRRTADTGVLLLEFCLNKPSSQRATEAVARMNYLHSRYIRAGKISNDDMLYTLSVFALEPVRWVNRYEWRAFTDLELCATGAFWKSMGDKMRIDFSALPSHDAGWRDGLHWLDEVRDCSERYERGHMVPAQSNHRLALAHLDVIFINLPASFKVLGQYLVATLVGDRLRAAMILPVPPKAFEVTIEWAFTLRKLFLRHLCLPRPEYRRKNYISAEKEDNGRYSSKEYLSHPWYVKPTFARRWGLKAWTLWAIGRKVPGDDGNRYNPEGYIITEVGPKQLVNKGAKETELEMQHINNMSPGGCPFKPMKL